MAKMLIDIEGRDKNFSSQMKKLMNDARTHLASIEAEHKKIEGQLQHQIDLLKKQNTELNNHITTIDKQRAAHERVNQTLRDRVKVQDQLHKPRSQGSRFVSKDAMSWGKALGGGGNDWTTSGMSMKEDDASGWANSLSGGLSSVGKSAVHAGHDVRGMMYEVRALLNLMGLHANYSIVRFLSGLEQVQKFMSITFMGASLLMMIELMKQFAEKLEEGINMMMGWSHAAQEMAKVSKEINTEMMKGAEERERKAVEAASIGIEDPVKKLEAERIQLEKNHEITKKTRLEEAQRLETLQKEQAYRDSFLYNTPLIGNASQAAATYGQRLGFGNTFGRETQQFDKTEDKDVLEQLTASTKKMAELDTKMKNEDQELVINKAKASAERVKITREEMSAIIEEHRKAAEVQETIHKNETAALKDEIEKQLQAQMRTWDSYLEGLQTVADKERANAKERSDNNRRDAMDKLRNEVATLPEAERGKVFAAKKKAIDDEYDKEELDTKAAHEKAKSDIKYKAIDENNAASKTAAESTLQTEQSMNELSTEMTQHMHDQKLISYTQYYKEREKQIVKAEKLAKERADVEFKFAAKQNSPTALAQKQAAYDRADEETMKSKQALDLEQRADHLKAIETYNEAEVKSAKKASDEAMAAMEDAYKRGRISTASFYDYRRTKIEQDLKLTEREIAMRHKGPGLNEQPGTGGFKSEADRAAYTTEMMQAGADAKAQLKGLNYQAREPERGSVREAHFQFNQLKMETAAAADALKRMHSAINEEQRTNAEKDYKDATAKAQDAVKGFTSAISAGTQSLADFFAMWGHAKVAGFFQSVQAGQKGVGGIMGNIAGALGAFNKDGGGLTGMLGQIGAFAGGPIGTAITTVVGGVVGALIGHFKAEARRIAHDIQDKVSKITTALQSSSISSQQALVDIEAQRTRAITDLSHRKGGRDELNKLLPQLDQQILQLQIQIKETTRELQQQIAILSGPMGYQDQLSSLQAIYEAWRKYYLVVGDTADATNFLQLSLKKYVATQTQDLASANQQAIEDALNLNDLEYQRMTLLRDSAQQEYDILTQGVLVRRSTEAQRKLYDLQKMRTDRDRQLQDLDREISVAQNKVTMESKIFDIATDRIGLENQLVTVQTQVITYDMQRIAAMKDLVAQIKSLPLLTDTLSPDQINWFFNYIYNTAAQRGNSGFNGETQ